MISKKGTKMLHDAGYTDMEIVKGCYGFYLHLTHALAQRGATVCATYQECVEQAKAGKHPIKIV